MKNLKVNFIALVALVIGIVTMSFKLNQPVEDNFEWYERQSANTYVLLPGPPTAEPSNGCVITGSELCAKGFKPGTAPSEIKDNTPAENRYSDDL